MISISVPAGVSAPPSVGMLIDGPRTHQERNDHPFHITRASIVRIVRPSVKIRGLHFSEYDQPAKKYPTES
jgi:hypothetical protein